MLAPSHPPFHQLFRELAPDAGRALRNLGVGAANLPDAILETFVVVHRKLPSFRGTASLRTWIYGICLRVAATYRRRPHPGGDAGPEDTPVSYRTLQEEAERREALARLDAALGRLDDDRRAAFVLYELEELTLAEIAGATGAPLGTVYSRLLAARRGILAAFGEPGASGEAGSVSTERDPPRLLRGGDDVPAALSHALRAARSRRVGEAVITAVAARLPAGAPGEMEIGPASGHAAGGGPGDGEPPSDPPESGSARARDDSSGGEEPSPGLPGARGLKRRSGAQGGSSMWPGILVGAAFGALVSLAWLLLPMSRPGPAGAAPGSAQTASSTTAAPERPPAPSAAESEADYLRRAGDLLAGSPAEALALAEAHPRVYPGGKLGQEREVLAVAALSALGRKVEARARARVLLLLFPDSAHRPRLEALVPELKAPEEPPAP